MRIGLFLVAICLGSFTVSSRSSADEIVDRLAIDLQPWLECLSGRDHSFGIQGKAQLKIDGKIQPVEFRLDRHDDDSFDLHLAHPEYEVHFRRRNEGFAMALPKHAVVFRGAGEVDDQDHLRPKGIAARVVESGTSLSDFQPILKIFKASDLAGFLTGLAKMTFDRSDSTWRLGEARFQFSNQGMKLRGNDREVVFEMELGEASDPTPLDAWPSWRIQPIDRAVLEGQLCRGLRRGLEVLAPSAKISSPPQKGKRTEHGELRWVDGNRVVLLAGTPEEIGEAHGELLRDEAFRCIDSVVSMFGTVQTIATGRWFRDDLEKAYARLEPHIPERHKQETRALAKRLGIEQRLVETTNVFPELFHCSGFALFGNATEGGKLYHGRVLDYMTTIGLQDCAVTFIVAPQGKIPFANIGYAGFIGSVSGMNAEKISLGEMGGRGEGQWDGVPMATLMRRALEESSSLEEVKKLWTDSPRTCEYYYVFADGETKTAVGVAATPQSIQFVEPGAAHPLLGEGIRDAVVLSAGSRLEELRSRVKNHYGKIDAQIAQSLMCRPVAMNSNLHNVLFVPEDGVLYVANASHTLPAADRPYSRLELQSLLSEMPANAKHASPPLARGATYPSRDSLTVSEETKQDAMECLEGLVWKPTTFEVRVEEASEKRGDWLIRFPSPIDSGNAQNDSVALEWYQARDAQKNPVHAAAAIIVHESGSGMTVGRLIANGLRQKGIHSFMIQLPHYGVRRGPEGKPKGNDLFSAMKQGIADVRRAKDAISVLPFVDASRISIQGTSLGGFVAATTAGLDRSFHRVFILLAGGDLHGVVMSGKKDAANMRQELLNSGIDHEQLKTMLNRVEPLRLAHRMSPDRTWIFSGQFDDVVPIEHACKLAEAIGLPESHHVKLLADHYSGVIFLPSVLKQMSDLMVETVENSDASSQ